MNLFVSNLFAITGSACLIDLDISFQLKNKEIKILVNPKNIEIKIIWLKWKQSYQKKKEKIKYSNNVSL